MTGYKMDRRTVLKAGAGALGTAAMTGTSTDADGPTVYVGSIDETLYAVDAPSGTLEWEFTDLAGALLSSPTVVDGTVYAASRGTAEEEYEDAALYAIGAATGEQEWAFTHPSAEVYSSPTVVDGTVYVGSFDETLYAVDATTGEQEWTFEEPTDAILSTPTVVGGTVYFGAGSEDVEEREDTTLYAVDATTGNREWAFQRPTKAVYTPTVADGTVYVGSADGTLYAVDGATGEQEWTFTQPSETVRGAPTVVDDKVYVGSIESREESSANPTLYAVDTTTGELEWTFTDLEGELWSWPTVADGSVYVGSLGTAEADWADSALYAIDAATGEQEWAFTDLAGATQSSPTVADGTVYVGSLGTAEADWADSALYAIDAATGEQEWAFTDPSSIALSSPTVVDDPAGGHSIDSRVMLGTLGQHDKSHSAATAMSTPTPTPTLTPSPTPTPTPTATSDDGDGGFLGVFLTILAGLGVVGTIVVFLGGGGVALLLRGGGSDDADGASAVAEGGDTEEVSGTVNDASVAAARSDSAGGAGRPDEPIDDSDTGELDELLAEAREHSVDARAARNHNDLTETVTALEKAVTAYDKALAQAESAGDERIEEIREDREAVKRARAAARTTSERLAGIRDTLEQASSMQRSAEEQLDAGEIERARGTVERALENCETAAERLDDHDLPLEALERNPSELRMELESLLEICEDRLEVAPTPSDSRPAETIPRAPAVEFAYDDIEKAEPIGSGGNADVYRATATAPDGEITVALKEPRMSGTLHTETVDRILEEAETWSKLDDHDHVVSIVDYGAEPLPWIAMEYMDGGQLDERLADAPLVRKLWSATVITEAVHHAHRRGVAHLDLKPENVLLRTVEDGWDVPKVADWGLSKHLLEHSKSIEGLSPHYAAPEQFDDDYGPTDDVTDVYQLGAVFYELFTGRPPFEGQPAKVMNKVLNQEPTPPSEFANVPTKFDEILLRALAKEKAERYEHVLYLRDDLQELWEKRR